MYEINDRSTETIYRPWFTTAARMICCQWELLQVRGNKIFIAPSLPEEIRSFSFGLLCRATFVRMRRQLTESWLDWACRVRNGGRNSRNNPFQNPPPYEKLVGDLQGLYSRRINIQHRFVYQVYEGQHCIKIICMWKHYEWCVGLRTLDTTLIDVSIWINLGVVRWLAPKRADGQPLVAEAGNWCGL